MLNVSTTSPEARASEAAVGLMLPLGLQKPTVFAIQLHIKENAVKKSNQSEPRKLSKITELWGSDEGTSNCQFPLEIHATPLLSQRGEKIKFL